MFTGRPGWLEIVLVLGIILIIFGPGKLPGLFKAAGETIRNYKAGISGKDQDDEEGAKQEK